VERGGSADACDIDIFYLYVYLLYWFVPVLCMILYTLPRSRCQRIRFDSATQAQSPACRIHFDTVRRAMPESI